MKTEQEFLEGIYKKAEYAKTEVHSKEKMESSSFAWNRVIPVLSLCMVMIIAVPMGIRQWQKEHTTKKENIYKAKLYDYEEVTNVPMVAKEQRNRAQMSEIILLYGTIDQVDYIEDQVNISLKVEEIYQGNALNNSQNISIYAASNDIWFGIEEHKTQILCYLITSETGYKLNHGDYSIYLYQKEENDEIIFTAKDGTTVSSAILCQDME